MLIERMMTLANKNKVEGEQVAEKITFSKEKILSAKRYRNRVDLLGVLLKDGKQYTFDEVDALLDEFFKKKGKVK